MLKFEIVFEDILSFDNELIVSDFVESLNWKFDNNTDYCNTYFVYADCSNITEFTKIFRNCNISPELIRLK